MLYGVTMQDQGISKLWYRTHTKRRKDWVYQHTRKRGA